MLTDTQWHIITVVAYSVVNCVLHKLAGLVVSRGWVGIR